MIWWMWFLLGISLGALGTRFAIAYFPRLNLLDFPERYNLDRPKLPYPGGLVLFVLSLGLILIDFGFWLLLLPLVVLGLVSFIDDRYRVSAIKRLCLQFWLASFLVIMGVQIDFITNPFADTNFAIGHYAPWIAAGLTVIWIVAIQNAINWFDGLPGLSVGVSGIGFLTLGILGLIRPELWFDPTHGTLTLANFYLAGLCVGGWWYYWRGRIILGDTGSQVLGFLLAVMAIWSGAKIATTLMVLSLPMLDFAWVIFRRVVFERKSPFSGDLSHMHHLLAQKAQARTVALCLILSSAILGLAALFLEPINKLSVFGLLVLVIISFNWWLWQRLGR